MNDENLKKGVATQFRSGEQAASIAGQKGGIASGESRSIKAQLKDVSDKDYKTIAKNLVKRAKKSDRATELLAKLNGELSSTQINADVKVLVPTIIVRSEEDKKLLESID